MLGSLPVDVPTRYSDVEACDVLVIPGGGGVRTLLEDQDFLGWLRRVHATTRFTTSVCTGSLLLAAAGLLDGLTAATHWGAVGEIEGYGATYTPERVVRHGRIITSAGVSSGIDMALHLAALLPTRPPHRPSSSTPSTTRSPRSTAARSPRRRPRCLSAPAP